jgi:hypothetical protein
MPQPLAYSEVVMYAEWHGYTDSQVDLDEFVELVYAQEIEYLNVTGEKRKQTNG